MIAARQLWLFDRRGIRIGAGGTRHLYGRRSTGAAAPWHLARRARLLVAALGIVEHEIHARFTDRTGLASRVGVTERRAQVEIDRGCLARRGHRRLAHQIEVDAVLAALEIE